MIKNKDDLKYRKPEIDITGPEGNAFCLLGYAMDLCKKLNINYGKVSEEMKSGDYENLISVFDKYFGEYVDLIR